jgi:hypothetical protein
VVCANGVDPVAGATVCAYDVDWWWWWWSKDLVGCATTDLNGAFEIDFTRCCGWWPWWWWERRIWQLNPHLLDRILAFLQRDQRFVKLPTPSPKPSLDIFQPLLSWSAAGAGTKPAEMLRMRSSQSAPGSVIDPASLGNLREQLLKVLPPAPEFEKLKLWPWWPWRPWWDCNADIIFHVTQNCQGKDNVVLDETIWDGHWDISTDFNVTLTANDQACCVHRDCMEDCPTGACLLPTDICYSDNVGSIGGNEGAVATTPVGLLNPGMALQPGTINGKVSYNADRPYAGSVPIYGAFGDQADVDYYEFMVYYAGKAISGTPLPVLPDPIRYVPLPPPAFGGFDRQHLVLTPSPHWPSVPFNVQAISDGTSDHYVIESIAHYEDNNGAQLWDSGSFNLLAVLSTVYNLADGTYYLQVKAWTRKGGTGDLSNPRILPVCGTENNEISTANYWVVTIDNQVATSGQTDVNGIPCGPGTVHLCTGQPETAILKVQILHEDNSATTVGACANVCIVDTDQLVIDFVAYDPDAYLGYYTLQVVYGSSLGIDLLGLGGKLDPSPIAPSWAPAATEVGWDYAQALTQTGTSPWWKGGSIRLTVKAAAAFPETCAYDLQLYAHKRTISGCDHSFWNQYNVSELSFTIVNPCPPKESRS